MSSFFSKIGEEGRRIDRQLGLRAARTGALGIQPIEEMEEVAVVEETATEARRRERKRLLTGGRRSTILSGISAVLKKRLGE